MRGDLLVCSEDYLELRAGVYYMATSNEEISTVRVMLPPENALVRLPGLEEPLPGWRYETWFFVVFARVTTDDEPVVAIMDRPLPISTR